MKKKRKKSIELEEVGEEKKKTKNIMKLEEVGGEEKEEKWNGGRKRKKQNR